MSDDPSEEPGAGHLCARCGGCRCPVFTVYGEVVDQRGGCIDISPEVDIPPPTDFLNGDSGGVCSWIVQNCIGAIASALQNLSSFSNWVAGQSSGGVSIDDIENDPGFNSWLNGKINDAVTQALEDANMGCSIPQTLCATAADYGIVIGSGGTVDLAGSGIPSSLTGSWNPSTPTSEWEHRLFSWYAAAGVTMTDVNKGTTGSFAGGVMAHPQVPYNDSPGSTNVTVHWDSVAETWEMSTVQEWHIDVPYGFGSHTLGCS